MSPQKSGETKTYTFVCECGWTDTWHGSAVGSFAKSQEHCFNRQHTGTMTATIVKTKKRTYSGGKWGQWH